MKVNVNFTVEFDIEKYREVYAIEDDEDAKFIRKEISMIVSSDLLLKLTDDGVPAKLVRRKT
jgi:hypothetical protein